MIARRSLPFASARIAAFARSALVQGVRELRIAALVVAGLARIGGAP